MGALLGDSMDSAPCLLRVNPAVEESGWVQKKGDSSENENANQMGRGERQALGSALRNLTMSVRLR